MIKMPPHRHEFPRAHTESPTNSWGHQWAHLPRNQGRLVRVKDKLKVIPID